DALGIDHHRRSELAAIKAARGIDAHVLQSKRPCLVLHVVAQGFAALVRAAAARMAGRPLVGATEDMRLIVGRGVARLFAIAHFQATPSCRYRWRLRRAATRRPAAA